MSDTASLNIRSDKRKFPPHGLFGGKNGSKSYNFINPDTERKILPVLMTEVEKLKKGDVFSHEMSGGGGYGNPFERDIKNVLDDVLSEKVTKKHALEEYGVVIKGTAGIGYSIDENRTITKRILLKQVKTKK